MFFEVELKRESYVVLTIEAEAKAWEELQRTSPREEGYWSLASIEDAGEGA